MNAHRALHRLLPPAGALLLGLFVAATAFGPRPAAAFQVEDRGTAGLDGKIVMSPAAERIETVEADGGDPVGPGSRLTRAVIIHNRSEARVNLELDVAEVVGANSDLVVEIRHGYRGGAAAWATLERNSVALKPGQQATILVDIVIPKGVKPGSKPFAVTATQRGGVSQGEGAGIAPQFKQVGIFIIELPGDAPVEGALTKATITSADKSLAAARDGAKTPENARLYVGPGFTGSHKLTIATEYENTGERLLTPTGAVVVRDIFGRVAGRYEIKKFTVYPDGESAGQVELKGLPSLGIFQAKVELESSAGKQTTTLPRFVAVPKWFLLVLAGLVLYVATRVLRWQLRRRAEWKRYLDEPDGGDSTAFDGDADESDEWAYDESERA